MSRDRVLWSELPPEQRGAIPTLNDVPPDILAEARRLAQRSRGVAVDLLMFYVASADLGQLYDFVRDVVEGGEAPETWGVSDVLCTQDISVEQALVGGGAAVLGGLSAIEGERWWRMQPAGERWSNDDWPGAPGVLVKRVPYYWRSPTPAREFWHSPGKGRITIAKIEVAEIDLAVRRWLASRVAWKLHVMDSHELTSVEEVCAVLGVEVDRVSTDGRLALTGMVHELTQIAPGLRRFPGFDGPDDWYRELPAAPDKS
jgi:hypothetical protein